MNFNKWILSVTFFLFALALQGQNKDKVLNLKKGQVLDILLFNMNPDNDAAIKRYFTEAIPIAQEMGYTTQPSFQVISPAWNGSYQPELLIFGAWPDIKIRKQFLETIVDRKPDFHDHRREIWSNFFLTYYELKEDLSIELKASSHFLATALWSEKGSALEKTHEQLSAIIQKHNGKKILILKDGYSPMGYYYNPDLLLITEFRNEEDFLLFKEELSHFEYANIKHINQFQIK